MPLRRLSDAGAQIALSADDPLLFLSRLTDQYEIAREQGFSDAELASFAKDSITASMATIESKQRWLREVDEWLAEPAEVVA